MLIINPANGRILDANQALLDFYGYSLNEIRSMVKKRADQGRGGIAHDFNNLLTGIIGYSDLLQLEAQGQEELIKESVELQSINTPEIVDIPMEEKGGLLTIRLNSLEVEDQGIGIEKEALNNIVVPYFTSKRIVIYSSSQFR